MGSQYAPCTIESGHGETIKFLRYVKNGDTEVLELEGRCTPGAGPAMHIHHRQDESVTVVNGKIGYQVLGGPEVFAGPGQSVSFPAGVAHRFWNAGEEELRITGHITPPNNVQFFLTAIYASSKANGGTGQPGFFDGAWLMTRYRSEFDMPEIPAFVKRRVFPAVVLLGRLLGKYRKYTGAPAPL